jgi:hypothetical protein
VTHLRGPKIRKTLAGSETAAFGEHSEDHQLRRQQREHDAEQQQGPIADRVGIKQPLNAEKNQDAEAKQSGEEPKAAE